MTIGVAWFLESEAQLVRGHNPVMHVQDDERDTTLCGYSLAEMELDFWDDQGADWPGCRRCAKVLKARQAR